MCVGIPSHQYVYDENLVRCTLTGQETIQKRAFNYNDVGTRGSEEASPTREKKKKNGQGQE